MNISILIKAAQNGDEDSLIELINRFEPLLKKYASKCIGFSDDAHSELQLAFIILILDDMKNGHFSFSNERGVKKYIQKSIQHAYITLSKNHEQIICELPFSCFGTLDDPVEFENQVYEYDDYFPIELENILRTLVEKKDLTLKEALTVKLVYCEDCLVKDVAKRFGLSPSAVSQIKTNAIKKLKLRIAME